MNSLASNVVNYCLSHTTNERYMNHSDPKEQQSLHMMKSFTTVQLVGSILTVLVIQLLILVFGKFLWNNFATKAFTNVQPVSSIWTIFAISILVKIMIA